MSKCKKQDPGRGFLILIISLLYLVRFMRMSFFEDGDLMFEDISKHREI
jgi:hypothetical protein